MLVLFVARFLPGLINMFCNIRKACTQALLTGIAYSCDFGHSVMVKADTSHSERTCAPGDYGHLNHYSFSQLFSSKINPFYVFSHVLTVFLFLCLSFESGSERKITGR